MHVYDSANGGYYEYTDYVYNNPKADKVRTNIQLLNEYIKTLEPRLYGEHSIKVDVDMIVDDLFNVFQEKKLKKNLVGIPNANEYTMFTFKTTLDLIPKVTLQKQLNLIKTKHCTNGKVILNTNLETYNIN